MITPCKIQSGRLLLDRDKLKSWCGVQKDGEYEMYITKKKELRTLNQLHLWWGVILNQFMLHIGYREDELTNVIYRKECHDSLKALFEPPQMVVSKLTGEEKPVLWSMADASKQKIQEFIDWFLIYASTEHGFIFEFKQ